GGSGLGLSTVHGIVRQSGGFVTVDSTVGDGTCVRFWLPRHEETEVVSGVPLAGVPLAGVPRSGAAQTGAAETRTPPAATPDGAAAPPPLVAESVRFLLLVEDEESVRRLTERALQRAGWQVSAVDSAEAALERLP